MITDDPIADLGRQLVDAAATRSSATVPGYRRSPMRRVFMVAGPVAAIAVAAVVLLAVLLPGGAGAPSIEQAAAAQLTPHNDIVYLSYESRSYNGGKLYQRARIRIWYSATRWRTIATSIGPRTGQARSSLEVVHGTGRTVSYESISNRLTSQADCSPAGPNTTSVSQIDPLALYELLRSGHGLRATGTTMFDGKRVARLLGTTERGHTRITYLVTPKTGVPVAMEVRPARLPASPAGHYTGTVVRFTSHKRITNPHLLDMSRHPGAKTTDLGRSRCHRR